MGNLSKSAELAELKTLRNHLKNWEKAQNEVKSYEDALRKVGSKSAADVHVYQAPTNQYEKEHAKYFAEQSQKKNALVGSFLTVAIIILVVLGICWLCMSGIFAKNTYLHTPEIVREYTGVYYNVQGHERNCTITITSCKENGKFEGTFEFSGKEAYTNKPFYGKYSVSGKITKKSAEGYVNATLEFKEWIERPSGWDPLESLKLKIYDNYEAIRCLEYNMSLHATDGERTAVSDLYTPEILKTYSGEFDPNTKVGEASITIESCSKSGEVTGIWEYSFADGGGKWKLSGQITKKFSDGSVVMTLNPGEKIYHNYMFYYPESIEVEIYDDYRSLSSLEGMEWFYEDEGFKKDPNPAKTPLQAAVNKAAPIVFPAYIVLAIVILIVLSSKKPAAFTPEQQRKLDELRKLDSENRTKNEKARKEGIARAQKQQQKETAEYRQWLEGAKQRVQESAYLCSQMRILSDEDKTLANVEFLIQKMESGRADSLKEALNLMDEDTRHRRESFMRAEIAHQESMRRMQAEAEARRDQMYHNMNVEYQQRRQAEELEKIRKALED